MLDQYKNIDFDSEYAAKKSKESLHTKKCLYDNYCDTYHNMMRLAKKYLTLSGDGVEVELGSGGGFFKEMNKKIITSDVTDINGVDMVIDAQNLPFDDNSVNVIYAVHVIHHIPDINKFLNEVNRCCVENGGCVLVEPYWSPIGKLFYKNFHPEDFDEKVERWEFEYKGAMASANQALSYIILKRDRKKFEELYPNLKVVYDRPFNGMRYIATGGLWLKPFLPQFMFPIITFLEKMFWPFMYLFGIHHVFVIKKVV